MRMIRDATSQLCHRLIGLRSNPVQSRPIPSNPRAIYNGSATAQATERSQLRHRRRWQLGDRHISTPYATLRSRSGSPWAHLPLQHGCADHPRVTPRYSPPALPARRPISSPLRADCHHTSPCGVVTQAAAPAARSVCPNRQEDEGMQPKTGYD